MGSRDDERHDRSLVDATLDAHRGSMWAVAEVEACLGRTPDREGRWAAELLDKLEYMEQTLDAHFVAEEKGALFQKLPLSHPTLAGRISKLQAEHDRIREKTRQAIDKTRRLADPQNYEVHELNAQVQLLVAIVERHEAEENELVIEAHWNEVGVGD